MSKTSIAIKTSNKAILMSKTYYWTYIEQSSFVICADLKFFVTTECGYVMKSIKKTILAGWVIIFFVNCYPGNRDIILLALTFYQQRMTVLQRLSMYCII